MVAIETEQQQGCFVTASFSYITLSSLPCIVTILMIQFKKLYQFFNCLLIICNIFVLSYDSDVLWLQLERLITLLY